MKGSLCRIALLGLAAILAGCSGERAALGSKSNPVKIYFVPSTDAAALKKNAKVIKAYLEKQTPFHYKTAVPASYIAVVEAFGTKRVDVAALNTFGYLLANDKFGAEARLAFRRFGQDTYSGQIVAHVDGPIQKLEDIAGKKFAYVDSASLSGYVLPANLFRERGIKLGETIFARRHDNVITMVYNRQVDAGATFYSPPAEGLAQDARRLVRTQYPDIEEKVKIIELTAEVPIEPMVFRKGMPEKMKTAVINALLQFIETDEGRETFRALYEVTGLREAKDSDYDGVRKMIKKLEIEAADLLKK